MRDVKSFDSNLFTCQDHSLVKALLESAELTPVSLHLVDFTVSVCHASVDPTKNIMFSYVFCPMAHKKRLFSALSNLPFVLDSPLEEPLAPFTGDDPVVESSGPVFADHAGQLFLLFRGCWRVGRPEGLALLVAGKL